MAEGRSASLWQHTSALLAMFHNVNAEAKDRKSPDHFDPHKNNSKTIIRDPEHAWAIMRGAFAPDSLRD